MRPEKGALLFVELTNRSGKREYWGKRPGRTGQKTTRKATPVTLTLQARERSPSSPGKPEWVRNIWAMTPVSNGITVDNDLPHAGQHILGISDENIQSGNVTNAATLATDNAGSSFPPKNPPNNLYIGEDRQPASEPQDQSMRLPPRW